MATLLYITVNSKPEDLSTSKTVGRIFINKYKDLYPDDTIEELDLYQANIPRINYRIFTSRATLASGEEYDRLSDEEKQQVEHIRGLCDQFLNADKYVIAAPMWSLFFPSMLKQYLDCIIQNKKLIDIDTVNNKVSGLLGDKKRKMIYIQSSGAQIPFFMSPIMNKGVNYLHDIFKFLGIKKFEKILVDGVNDSSVGRDMAIQNATEEINDMMEFF